jgi:ATP-binding cassette subfamily B protein
MFRIFRNFHKKDWLFLLGGGALVACQVWLELTMPDYMNEITKLVQTEGSDMGDIMRNGGWMLACAFGSFIASIGACYFFATASASLSMNTRKKLFDKVESLDMHDVKKFSTSSLITRTTNDITQIQMFVATGAQILIRAPLTAAWAITKIAGKSWQWSTITGVAVVILLSTIIAIMSVVIPRFKIIQKLTDRINGITRENLTGIRVVRAFNAEKYQEKKFAKTNDELTNIQIFNGRLLSILSPTMYLIMNGVTLAIYIAGAYMINGAAFADKLDIFSNMIVFVFYATHVIISFLMITIVLMIMPRAQVSASRINEVIKTKISIKDGDFDGDTAEVGTVEFRNVSFRYPDAEENLLTNISFRAEKGETVAFVGSTGSGKSTLINLIPRFYDANEGEVFVDGVDVRNYKQAALRNRIGYISQKAVIFDGSIEHNVSYGDNGRGKKSEKDIKDAVRVAQAKSFVEKMDKQYKSHVAQGGTNISGGQKQRLAIARAIARDPEIYIFDDSFSALDYKTDAKLRADLEKHTNGATKLIVAQRIGTVMHADKIIVLDDGKCVGIGKHKELLKNCDVYRQIALSQLSAEELNV